MELSHIRENNDNISLTFQWVKSHQDQDDDHTLTKQELINQRADDLATGGREDAIAGLLEISPKQIYTNAIATLTVKGSVVSKDMKKVVMNALYGENMTKYLKNKYNWNDITFNDIDWDAHENEVENIRGLYKISIHKLLHRWQPTNKVVQRNERKTPDTAKCTECNEIDDQLHYIKCHSAYFEEARKFAWNFFKNGLKKYKKNKTMTEIMWIGIKRWIYGEGDNDLPRGDDVTGEQFMMLKEAYKQQGEIG